MTTSVVILDFTETFDTVSQAILQSEGNDDGDGNEKRQKSNRFIQQNNNFARAAHFSVHFFAVTTRLRRENA